MLRGDRNGHNMATRCFKRSFVPNPSDSPAFSVSVVTYKPDRALLARTLSSLLAAFDSGIGAHAPRARLRVVLIDNGDDLTPDAYTMLTDHHAVDLTVLSGHGNVGYGAGHNLALPFLNGGFHIVLNPDVELERDALANAVTFLDSHPDTGLIAPLVRSDAGGIEYLCRRYPSVLTLLVRGFFPSRLRMCFTDRLARYELRDVIGASGELLNARSEPFEPQIISGCFMLYRTSVFKALGGFDPRYFLYFEDYDLSLRTARVSRIAYVPQVRIVHSGGGAARKGRTHIGMFIISAFRFFVRFGWKWF